MMGVLWRGELDTEDTAVYILEGYIGAGEVGRGREQKYEYEPE